MNLKAKQMNHDDLRVAVWAAEFTRFFSSVPGPDGRYRAEVAAQSAETAVAALDYVLAEKIEPFCELDRRCRMTWASFLHGCMANMITDDDGHGVLATEVGISKVPVEPSVVVDGRFTRPPWATHVVWYNK
jgi:hypothetical protein